MTNDIVEDHNPFHAKVVRYVDSNGEATSEKGEGSWFRLLISAGEDDGIRPNARVVVFALGEEILDPDTGESLGRFEIVKGEGKVEIVQSRMAIIRSERKRKETRRKQYNNALAAISPLSGEDFEDIIVSAPFLSPEIGDFVRFI